MVIFQTINLQEIVKRQGYFILAALSISLFVYVFYRTEKTAVNEIVI